MRSRVATQAHSDADKVRTLIAWYLGLDIKQVTDEAHLSDDLGLDWLDLLELMVVIEDEFIDVDFFANTIAHIRLVGDLIQHVEDHNERQLRRSAA